jgi:hypothetical protein
MTESRGTSLLGSVRDCFLFTWWRLREWHDNDRHASSRVRQHCLDCGVDTFAAGEYYKVWPDVWERSGLHPDDGMLCLGCLEARIGRTLSTFDFEPVACNFEWPSSSRLRSRLLGREAARP